MCQYQLLATNLFCSISLIVAFATCLMQGPKQESDSISPRELVIQYAKTNMDLAATELEWANRSADGVLPQRAIERRRSDLAVAKEQYNQAVMASTGGLEKIRLCHAEEKVRLAKLDLGRAERLKRKNSISDIGIQRARLKYKLAELKLALLRNPENFVTFMEAMQAQIDRIEQETLNLDQRITKLEKSPTLDN